MLRRQLPQVQPICQPQPQHNCVQQLVISTLPRQPAARHLRPLVLCIAGVLLHPLAVRVEARGPAEAAALRGWEVLDEGKRGGGGEVTPCRAPSGRMDPLRTLAGRALVQVRSPGPRQRGTATDCPAQLGHPANRLDQKASTSSAAPRRSPGTRAPPPHTTDPSTHLQVGGSPHAKSIVGQALPVNHVVPAAVAGQRVVAHFVVLKAWQGK